jgi:hypothetical protein
VYSPKLSCCETQASRLGGLPIARTGRYAQLNLPVTGSGWSQTDVTVTRCEGGYLMAAYSPRINFP